jgi:hypothetical protein
MSQRINDPSLATQTATRSVAAGVEKDAPRAETAPTPRISRQSVGEQRPRQTKVVLRRVGPWSVLKFSLLFYFCVMLVVLLALGMLYAVLGAVGALDSMTRLARDLFAEPTFAIHGGWIFSRLLLIGLAMVVVWSLINLFIAFLYNLISDVVGGVEITLAERR